jgi:hypothetical protein
LHEADRTLQLPDSSVQLSPDGALCVSLPKREQGANALVKPRYIVLEVATGSAELPVRAHLYDRGAAGGLSLVGIERD